MSDVLSDPPGRPAADRLDSWKEIAAYLRRDVTTVQRWEKREGLPVHRHLHDKLGSVYAFKSELDAWWNDQRRDVETPPKAPTAPATGPSDDKTEAPRGIPGTRTTVLAAAAMVAAIASGWWTMRWQAASESGVQPPATDSSSASASVAARATPASAEDAYDIEVTFHRAGQEGGSLVSGARVSPGDALFLALQASEPVYTYIVNEDERGEAYLLFPLPGVAMTNPLPPNVRHELPGWSGGQPAYWQVTSAGGREHFFVITSRERLVAFESVLGALPVASPNRPLVSAPLTPEAIGVLRGVGGITAGPARPAGSRLNLTAEDLIEGRHTARGVWIRHLALENPR